MATTAIVVRFPTAVEKGIVSYNRRSPFLPQLSLSLNRLSLQFYHHNAKCDECGLGKAQFCYNIQVTYFIFNIKFIYSRKVFNLWSTHFLNCIVDQSVHCSMSQSPADHLGSSFDLLAASLPTRNSFSLKIRSRSRRIPMPTPVIGSAYYRGYVTLYTRFTMTPVNFNEYACYPLLPPSSTGGQHLQLPVQCQRMCRIDQNLPSLKFGRRHGKQPLIPTGTQTT